MKGTHYEGREKLVTLAIDSFLASVGVYLPGVKRPIWLPANSVNQIVPPGPVVIPLGDPEAVNSVIEP